MELLLILLVLVVLVTLIGHGLWLLIASLLRGGRSRDDARRYEPTLSDDRAAAARYLERLRARGTLDQTMHAQLMRLLADDARCEAGRGEPAPGERRPETGPAPGVYVWRPAATPALTVPVAETSVADTTPPAPTPEERPPPVDAALPAASFAAAEPPATAAPPRRPLGVTLAGFMAEKNIRWGELTGGILILACSAALVISLWSQIAAIPVLKFVIFTGVTAALFGGGLFVHHRWMLPTTGPAVLLIAALLVPLNFLALAAFSAQERGGNVWTTGIELLTVVLFSWLTLLAGRVILADAARLLATGIVGLSGVSLAVPFVLPLSATVLFGAAGLLTGAYVLLMTVGVARVRRAESAGETESKRLLLQLGMHTYACLAPLGLLVYESGNAWGALHRLAPLVPVLAAPALLVGIWVWRRSTAEATPSTRTTGISVTLIAAAGVFAAVAFCWPIPSRLMFAVVVSAFVTLGLGRWACYPRLQPAVAIWLGAAWLLGIHLVSGTVVWSEASPIALRAALLSARTGQALVAVVLACLLLAAELHRRRQSAVARGYLGVSLAAWLISTVLVTTYGFGVSGDARHVSWVYLVYSVLALAVGRPLKSRWSVWIACFMGQLAIAQVLVYVWPPQAFAWPTALLAGASLGTIIAVALRWNRAAASRVDWCGAPLIQFAAALSLLALGWMVRDGSAARLAPFAGRMAWLSGLWLALALACRSPLAFAGSQMTLVVAAGAAVQHFVRTQTWCAGLSSPLREPRVWQAHLMTAASLCLIWACARTVIAWRSGRGVAQYEPQVTGPNRPPLRASVWSALLHPRLPTADRWIALLVLLGLVGLSVWSAGPRIWIELGGRIDPATVGQCELAARPASWTLLALVAVTFGLSLRAAPRGLSAVGLLTAADCAIALAAARFGTLHQVVSVCRWGFASTFLVATGGVCALMSGFAGILGRLRASSLVRPASRTSAFAVCFAWLAMPAVLLTASLIAALGRNAVPAWTRAADAELRIALLGPIALIVVGLLGYGVRAARPAYAAAAALLANVVVTGTELGLLGRAGLSVSAAQVIGLVQVNVIVLAGVALVWLALLWVTGVRGPELGFPRALLVISRLCLGLALAWVVADLWLFPGPVSAIVGQAGTAWGILAVLLMEAAWLTAIRRASVTEHAPSLTTWAVLAAVLAACALAPFDTSNWLCFHALMLGFVVVGGLRLFAGQRQLQRRGAVSWHEAFETAAMLGGSGAAAIAHNVACNQCGYNLRGLARTGNCPECHASIAASLEAVVGKLAPQWAALAGAARARTGRGVLACATLCTLFALRASADDPDRPWWSSAALAAAGALGMALGGWAPRRVYAYLGGLGAASAASIWWVTLHWHGAGVSSPTDLSNLIHVNITALAAAGIVWLFVERWFVLPRVAADATGGWPALHHAVAAVATVAVSTLAGRELFGWASGTPFAGVGSGSWLAWGITVLLLCACGLRPALRNARAGIYVLGLAGLALLATDARVPPRALPWTLSLGLAAYVLLAMVARRVLMLVRPQTLLASDEYRWFPWVSALCTIASVALAVHVSLTHPESSPRMLVVASPLLGAVSMLMLPRGQQRSRVRTGSLVLVLSGIVLLTWSQIAPGFAAVLLLQRAIGLVTSVAGATFAMSMCARQLPVESDWRRACGRATLGAWVVAAAALLYSSGHEALALATHEPLPLPQAAVGALIGALALLIGCCVLFATRDAYDPLRLSSAAKEAYVYVAEWLAVALALHVRATLPWLFSGFIVRYWPILIVGLSFIAVTAGELCARRALGVVARPLTRTGVFLPVLVLPELWLASARVHFSVVLLTSGVLYAVLATLRRSVFLGVLGAAALTGSLWYLLGHTEGLGIARHPQLWFIPPAVAVLVAGHINRAQIHETHRQALQYACLFTIYMSSTADVFLVGMAQAPWLPLVLAVLSVAGILVGIAARVRSFLLVGTGFLCLSLLSMVWHAAADLGWTWVWYVAGIGLGFGIITLFALFEKKRHQMSTWFGGLKR
jgi:hypothetical protein